VSDRTTARLERILATLPWVMAHPEDASVDEVCRRFGYTPGDLGRDLGLVMMCGLPGYYPHDLIDAEIFDDHVVVRSADYFGATRRLTPSEGLRLLAAALASDASGAGSPVLRSAAAKLAAALLPDEDVVVVELADDPGPVADLRRAIVDRSRVRITYRSLRRDETTERAVDPWQVFTDLGRWYLDGFDHRSGEYRRFRVDRIQALAVEDATFDPPAELPEATAGYQPSDEDVRVVLRLRPAARWVAEYYPVTILSSEGDDLEVEFFASGTSVAVRLLLRLGPDADLVEGDEVAVALDAVRAALLRRYG